MEPEKEPASPSQISLWPLGLLGILALVSLLRPSNKSNKNCGQSNHPENTTTNPPNSTPGQPAVVAKVTPPPHQCNNPKRGRNGAPLWEKLAAGAVAIGTLGLLIVNIFLWCSTKKAADAAEKAAVAAQQQTELMRQQLIALSAAVVDVSPKLVNLTATELGVRMEFPNTTRATARYVCGEYQITKEALPSRKQIGEAQNSVINFPDLTPTDPVVGPTAKPDMDTIKFSQKEINDIDNVKLTITVRGTIHYWNGFDTTHKDFCFALYKYSLKTRSGKDCSSGGGQFLLCESYLPVLDSALKTRAWCLKKN